MGKEEERENHDPVVAAKDEKMLVVGIGASAGGIQALKTFFSHVPKESGNVYVVILHLSPEYESRLAQVLQASATIPVKQVKDRRMKIGPNCVFVIPPNRSLTIQDGYVSARAIANREERRAPVDLFFRELAQAHKVNAVGVILSGTGPNGSMGIKRVKEMGGIVVAQSPDEAGYSDMPRNSIATGLVDYILPVAEIPGKISEYKSQLGKVEIDIDDTKPNPSDETALYDIFVTIKARTGHDFINYKRASVLRRIERRMNVNQLTHLNDYADFLRESPDEAQALLNDLLISVTNFFRDREPFDHLQHEIVPKILRGKTAKDFVRVWVAGCATGEEAYSLAMIFSEQTHGKLDAPAIQIFATDIDTKAISIARAGIYSEADVADVSPERLNKFFLKENENYRVRREIRETVLFAIHNVLKDPPFSRLDLFTCRNLLIYLNRTAQRRVMETAHFALNPGGYLFVGSSETADTDDSLFVPVNKDLRIYKRSIDDTRSALSLATLTPAPQRLKQFTDSQRSEEIRALERLSYTALHQQLLEEYAPPSVVVNSDYDILHISDSAGRYMQIAGGEPSKNLLIVARPELRLELRSALYQSIQQRTPVSTNKIRVKTDSGVETLNVHVRPSFRDGDAQKGYLLVIFEPAADHGVEEPARIDNDEPLARRLEEELITTKSQLRSTVEQYEVQYEELRASNEELQAINEELRSAIEEIETGKEEAQSVSEELSTVNQELKVKIEELSQSNNDLENLINSTTVATIFLDRRLRVKLYTQSATRIFNLIAADLGRPLSDLKSQLGDVDLVGLAEKVLGDLQPYEQEIEADQDVWYLMRIVPYRTREDRIDGVVLTFLDISSRLKMEEELEQSRSHLAKALNIETVGVVYVDDDIRLVDCNDTFLKMTGFDRSDVASGRLSWKDLTPTEWHGAYQHAMEELRQTGYISPYEKEYLRRDGSRFYGLFAGARIGENKIVEYVIDISSKKEAEKDLRFKSRLLEAVEQSVIATDINGKVIYWNGAAERLYGWKPQEAVGRDIVRLNTPKTSVEEANSIMETLRGGKSWEGDFEVVRKDGSVVLAHVYNSPILDDRGNVAGIVGVSADVGDRRRTESTLRETQDRMRILVESATDYAIFTISEDNVVTSWSPGAEKIFGYKGEEIIGRSGELLFTPDDRERGVPEKEMHRATKDGSAEDERWHMRKDGTLFFASGIMQPLRPHASRGFVKICRDQTGLLEAQSAFRQRRMLQRIVQIQEDERRRIARDLHDTLGQQLTALRLKLEAVKANYGAEPAMMKAIDETQLMAKQIDDDLSFLNWELRPTSLDNLGLRNALNEFVREWSKNYGIDAEFHTTRTRRIDLPPEAEINLYRIAQEALNNILKHAKANKVNVLLERRKDEVVLVIEDDGSGFSPKMATRRKNGKGLGLVGMRERAALLGGTLQIESGRGKGTTVIARVPTGKPGADGESKPNVASIKRERG